MNKFERIINHLNCKIEILKINQPYANCPECVDKDIEDLVEIKNAMQELVGKETPKKRIFVEKKGGISAHDECPICRCKVSPIRCYCDGCGQRLE